MQRAEREVILVEDDAGMRTAVARVLRGAGYAVRVFDSAESFLGGNAEIKPGGCLVCDVRLPGIPGFELHRRVTGQGPTPAWIFITAHDDPIVREQAARADAALLLKPFEGRVLLALIERVVAEH